MSVFEAGFEATPGPAVGDWHPARFTPSLTGDETFPTEGDKLLRFASKHWSISEVDRAELDEWQRWLVRHVLETYPDDWPVVHLRGQLRYRQVVISMGRQNGKSLLAALFVLYFLALHVRGPRIIGLASVDRQARIVYDRVRYAVDQSPALSREIRTTGTRGITRRDGSGIYQTLPAREDSAQGEPASGGIYDELHLGLAALWDALVLAQRARTNSLIVGITTAGDDGSALLLRLYGEGAAAIDGADERFGFFCWESSTAELTRAGILEANPAIACGRVSLDVAYADAVKMNADTDRGPDGLTGAQRVTRYTLNRFVAGAADGWAPLGPWTATATGGPATHVGEIVYAIERTGSWEYAAITATSLDGGRLVTELVAAITDPDHDQLLEVCTALAARGRAVFAVDSTTLKALGDTLRDAGHEVWKLGAGEMIAAAQLAHGAISRRGVDHPGDPLTKLQYARARRRTTGDGWRLSRSLSTGGEIDAVISTVIGLYVASVRPVAPLQMF